MDAPLEPIRDRGAVAEVVARARDAGRAALDFEFLWERTYAPLACLAQLAVDDHIALIDPIEGADLTPIAELVADPGVEIVMHAPGSDLQLLGMGFGVRPANLFDIQIAAGFVGLGAGQGLATLLDRVLSVQLDKAERYTDWSKRPLTPAQLRYAAADVEHLFPLRDEIARRAEELDRSAWITEEIGRRFGEDATFVPDPDRAWRRVKGHGRLSGADRAVLRALAAWRERAAEERDRPASWIVPDRVLIEVARRRPTNADAVRSTRGLPDRLGQKDAEAMVEAVAAGRDAEPIDMPPPPPPRVQERLDVLVPLAAVLVTGRAADADIAPSVVATRDEISGYLVSVISGNRDPGPLGQGWRQALVGEAITSLATGGLALGASSEPPFLQEIRRPTGS